MEKKGSSFWFGFAIGVFLGVLVWYWQKSTASDEGALDLLDKYARTVAKVREMDAGPAVSPPPASVAAEAKPATKKPEASTEPEAPDAAAATAAPPDDLTAIKGIGPVYARRLQEAGITTFAALAAAEPTRVAEIVGRKNWQSADPADWIAAAADLVLKSDVS